MFRFASPQWLYLLLSLPVLWGLFIVSVRGRKRRIARFGKIETVATLIPDASPLKVRNKFIIYLAAMAMLILAVARPQSGAKLREVTREGIELILAVDVSNSMLAEDFEPNRLARTKFAIMRLLDGIQQDNVGLIAFAGDAYVQLPVTSDYTTARNFVERLSNDMISRQGTAIGAAINLASSSFSSNSDAGRVLVIISDGENHEDDALAAAEAAAAKGIKIYTIGIGTPEGAPISINGDFLKDAEGNIVVSKLDETMLEKIAITGSGAYIRATSKSVGLSEIIAEINKSEKSRLTSTIFEEFNEQFQYPLALALALLLVEGAIIPRRNRIISRLNIFRK